VQIGGILAELVSPPSRKIGGIDLKASELTIETFCCIYRILPINDKDMYMAFSKKTSFGNRQSAIADFADALSHPARVAILETLAKRKTCICGEIVEILPLAQSTVSQHLRALREAGLIKGEIDGPRSCYCIDMTNWKKIVKDIRKFMDEINRSGLSEKCC